MATPGFNAEASLGKARGHHRQISFSPAAAAELLGLAILPEYGKWCGDEQSGPETPIDAVDEVCCRHDQCYCERGDFDCSCDRALIQSMPGAIADPSTPAGGRTYGAAAAALFAADPFCLCHRICHPSLPPDVWECSDAGDLAVPGIPPLKLCPFPWA
jgi:hypothetical protein